jgi:hypothetical protein
MESLKVVRFPCTNTFAGVEVLNLVTRNVSKCKLSNEIAGEAFIKLENGMNRSAESSEKHSFESNENETELNKMYSSSFESNENEWKFNKMFPISLESNKLICPSLAAINLFQPLQSITTLFSSKAAALKTSYNFSPSRNSNSSEQKRSLNIGNAIRTLSQDIPAFCDSSSSPINWSIYSQRISFHDRIHSLSLYGLSKYQTLLNWTRSMLHLTYKNPRVEITNMHMQNEDTLAVRWRFTAQSRIPRIRAATFKLKTLWSGQKSVLFKDTKVVEGYFYYYFDSDGFISEHHLDQMEPPIQKINTLKAWFWWLGRHQPNAHIPPM